MIDLHMHTTYSDGKNSVKQMVDTAKKLGLKTIAITDHIWRSSDWFDEYAKEIKSIDSEVKVLIGFEAKALSVNGEIDATKVMCKVADIRIGAIHRIPKSSDINEYLKREEVLQNREFAYNNWLTTMKNLIKNSDVDIIAHPFMVLDKYSLNIDFKDIENLFKLASDYKKRLEVSARYKESNKYIWDFLHKKPNYINFISFGSDAHSIDDLIKAHT